MLIGKNTQALEGLNNFFEAPQPRYIRTWNETFKYHAFSQKRESGRKLTYFPNLYLFSSIVWITMLMKLQSQQV